MGKLNLEQVREMCSRYEAGEGAPTLGLAFGIAKPNVYYWLRKMGVATRPETRHSILTKEQLVDASRRYLAGESSTALALEFGVSRNSLIHLLSKRGVKMRGNKLFVLGCQTSDELIARVLKEYAEGASHSSIADTLGVSRGAVRNLLERQGVEVRGLRDAMLTGKTRKYRVNHSFFSEIDTEEKAYWMGFFAADGCVYKTRFQVGLARKDEDHLERLAKALECDYPIYRSTNPNSFGQIGEGSVLIVSSPQIVDDLKKHGFGPHKTFTHPWPHHLSDEMKRHFLRGYMDGDGSLYRKEDGTKQYFMIVSNTAFLEEAQKFLMEKCGLRKTVLLPHERTPGIGKLSYSGNAQVACIVRFLYADATIWLPRKKVVADLFLNHKKKWQTGWVLTDEQKAEMVKRREGGESLTSIGRDYGVTKQTVRNHYMRAQQKKLPLCT